MLIVSLKFDELLYTLRIEVGGFSGLVGSIILGPRSGSPKAHSVPFQVLGKALKNMLACEGHWSCGLGTYNIRFSISIQVFCHWEKSIWSAFFKSNLNELKISISLLREKWLVETKMFEWRKLKCTVWLGRKAFSLPRTTWSFHKMSGKNNSLKAAKKILLNRPMEPRCELLKSPDKLQVCLHQHSVEWQVLEFSTGRAWCFGPRIFSFCCWNL